MKHLAFFFIIALLSFMGCEQTPNKTYTLDNTVLGEELSDPITGVSVRPPLQWSEATLNNLEAYNSALSAVSPYQLKVSKMFLNNNIKGILLISDISGISKEIYQKLPTEYNEFFNTQNNWTTIKPAKVSINDLVADEYLMKSNIMVNYKLLFVEDQESAFQVDYLVPQSFHDKFMEEKIGASIASISR